MHDPDCDVEPAAGTAVGEDFYGHGDACKAVGCDSDNFCSVDTVCDNATCKLDVNGNINIYKYIPVYVYMVYQTHKYNPPNLSIPAVSFGVRVIDFHIQKMHKSKKKFLQQRSVRYI